MDEYVMISGASGGIGRALADEYASHGENLILVARRMDRLKSEAARIRDRYHVNTFCFQADLCAENSAGELYSLCQEKGLVVKTLINNAGIGAQGMFTDMAPDKAEEIVSLNILALLRMCAVFLPDMKKRGNGTVVNISSTTAFMPLANEAVYAASKAFVLSFSQALYEEMKPYGVTVCTVCPGVTNTEFFKTAGFSSEYFRGADPADFAAYLYKQTEKKKPLSVHRFSNRAISVWARLFPRAAVRKISARFG